MLLLAYQVGDLNLYHQLVSDDGSGISVQLNSQWRTPSEDFSTIGGQKLFTPLTRAIAAPGELKIDGAAMQTDWLGINEFVNSLKAFGGRQGVPIIAFRLEDSPNNGRPEVDWLVAYGTITNIPMTSTYADRSSGLASIPVSFSMTLDTPWQRLSPWEWEYRTEFSRIVNPVDPWSSPSTPDTRFAHPWKEQQFLPGAYFYRWKLAASDDNPSFWELKYSDGITGGKGSDFVLPNAYEFYADPRYWSAAPRSIYAFTGCETDGTISITVSRQIGLFYQDMIDEVSELDLAVLSATMETKGYGPLQLSDQIITGLVAPLPGYVIRDEEILADVRPIWNYPGTYPGETGQGWNKVSVQGVDTPLLAAYLHEYGAY